MGDSSLNFYLERSKGVLPFQEVTPAKGTGTSGSRNVMKAKALKGLGMKTSVTSPNLEK